MDKYRGSYLGTEINETWWRRYTGDGFLARGAGEYWFDETALCFQRYLTRSPLCIPYACVVQIKTGTWHAGTWRLGAPIVKVIWEGPAQTLSSGLIVAREESRVHAFIDELSRRVAAARTQ